MIPFQDLRLSNEALMPELEEAALRVLHSGRYVGGQEVADFEKLLALNCGSAHCVAVSNGLDALRLILKGYIDLGRLKPGDEVILPANTFIATALAVTECGLTAVVADVDADTFCLDLTRLPLSDKTRALIPVHLYGNPCWDSSLFTQLHDREILIIEDNAQAIGAITAEPGLNGGYATGNLGDAAAISFYPAKNVGAFGDAGAVMTNDDSLASTVRMLSNYGSSRKYSHELCGGNCRMDVIQAALLSVKLPHLEEIVARRNEIARLYSCLIKNPEVRTPQIFTDGSVQVWHQYVVRHSRRDELRQYLSDSGVGTEIHYPVPVHMQPCYSNHPLIKVPEEGLPVAEKLAKEILSLPIADVSIQDVETISDYINRF